MSVRKSMELYGEIKEAVGCRVPVLKEAVGDNSIDNMIDELKRAVDVEMGQFVTALLNSNVSNFLYAYAIPQYEGFREALRVVLERYRVMDGTEQGDLFTKIENLFKDLFVEKYASLGPETAELVAKKYALQMVAYLKKNSIQANVDLAQDKTRVPY